MTIVKNSRQLIGCLLLVSLLFNGFACSLQPAACLARRLRAGDGAGDVLPQRRW
ncbi:MAG: hypothetical protein ROZ65_03420 [Pseudomonadaceae bacterium]|jgi:hypothetical protein|nr:hypothetical protein [Pseudomonadaceae bacterium]